MEQISVKSGFSSYSTQTSKNSSLFPTMSVILNIEDHENSNTTKMPSNYYQICDKHEDLLMEDNTYQDIFSIYRTKENIDDDLNFDIEKQLEKQY